MKIYEVTFITKKGGVEEWTVAQSGLNAKDAISKVRERWYAKSDKHMFDVSAKITLNPLEKIDYTFRRVAAR